ncbi:MAG: gliding motility-associated C-terminal domain-containing protein [Flavobacteriales bacterium]|nr:gliding motility-associated C-terminal domain-containing protein [Flavobacteriales bacterium]
MPRRDLLALHLLCTAPLCAQDHVANGDMEQYTLCPDYVSQIDRCVGWSRPTAGTSDYFNACLGVPFSMSVPDNQMGDEPARSGNGYTGLYAFGGMDANLQQPNDYREYITHALSPPLTPGTTYIVSFHVSLADVSKYAVNDLGALFSMAPPTRTDDHAIGRHPQVSWGAAGWLDDKSGWTRIAGCFTADSAYTMITIGHFHDAGAAFLQVPTNFPLTDWSYYFVEDVSVRALEAPRLGPDTTACGPVLLEVIDPEPGAVYVWNTGHHGPALLVDSSGTYAVTHTHPDCPLSDSITVTIGDHFPITLPHDTVVDLCADPTVLFDLGPLPPGATALWSDGTAGPQCIASSSGPLSVVVEGPGLCPSTAAVQVVDACVWPLHVPNAVTPNGDGHNDTWRPVWQAERITRWQVIVMDRWGRALFTTNDPTEAWDPTDVAVGCYAYRVEAAEAGSPAVRIARGHVTVVR